MSTPKTQRVAERRAQALNLRRMGWSYARIVAERPELGYKSVTAASKDVSRALKSAVHETGMRLLDLERERTDAASAAAWDLITNPQVSDRDRVAAIREVTRLLERRARLLGIDRAATERMGDEDQDQARGILAGFELHLQTAYGQLPATD